MGFGDMNGVKPSDNRLPYLEPGNYTLEINACKEVDGQKGKSFVVECTILASDNPARPVGSEMSVIHGMAGGIDLLRQNVKGFLVAALGEDPGPYTNDILALATGSGNVFMGRVVRCFGQLTQTKPKPGFPNGTPFTRANWSAGVYQAGTEPPNLAALLAAPPVTAAPSGYRQGPAVPMAPPPPPLPPPPVGHPWDGLPATHVTATHWFSSAVGAWVAK